MKVRVVAMVILLAMAGGVHAAFDVIVRMNDPTCAYEFSSDIPDIIGINISSATPDNVVPTCDVELVYPQAEEITCPQPEFIYEGTSCADVTGKEGCCDVFEPDVCMKPPGGPDYWVYTRKKNPKYEAAAASLVRQVREPSRSARLQQEADERVKISRMREEAMYARELTLIKELARGEYQEPGGDPDEEHFEEDDNYCMSLRDECADLEAVCGVGGQE